MNPSSPLPNLVWIAMIPDRCTDDCPENGGARPEKGTSDKPPQPAETDGIPEPCAPPTLTRERSSSLTVSCADRLVGAVTLRAVAADAGGLQVPKVVTPTARASTRVVDMPCTARPHHPVVFPREARMAQVTPPARSIEDRVELLFSPFAHGRNLQVSARDRGAEMDRSPAESCPCF